MINYFWISSGKCKNKVHNKIAIIGLNCQNNLFTLKLYETENTWNKYVLKYYHGKYIQYTSKSILFFIKD